MSDERVQSGRMLDLIRSKGFVGQKALIEDLRREKTERSVGLLLEILSDESWSLRELAVSALADAGELAAPHLMALLEGGLWYSRASAARALGEMGHVPALSPLLHMLDDANRTISESAARALLDLAMRGSAVACARGLLARGDVAEDAFRMMDRLDPDGGRKLRILAAREEVNSPVLAWLDGEDDDRDVFAARHLDVSDEDMEIRWDDISGPVRG